MKKIIGTILAAGLAISAFAAEPAANFVMTQFDGWASLDFKANFEDKSYGMENKATADVKFGFFTGGDKATTGDGIWGELKVVTEDGSCDPIENGGTVKVPTAKVDTAKIHFVDGDFSAALNILKDQNLNYGTVSSPSAIGDSILTTEVNASGFGHGFTLELGMAKLFSLNVRFLDNGIVTQENKKFGLGLGFSLDAVDKLTAKVNAAFNFTDKYTGMNAELAYKLGITDSMYVKPGLGFSMIKNGTADLANYLEAGVLFGVGGSGLKPELDFVNSGSDAFAEGVSVAVGTDLKSSDVALKVGAYYESLFNVLGLSDFGKLSLGAQYVMNAVPGSPLAEGSDQKQIKDTLAFAGKYKLELSPIHLDLHGGMQMYMFDGSDSKVGYKFGATLGSTEIIDNTDVYVSYEFEDDPYVFVKDAAPATTGKFKQVKKNLLTIGTKISF